jgi:hypothetical protein
MQITFISAILVIFAFSLSPGAIHGEEKLSKLPQGLRGLWKEAHCNMGFEISGNDFVQYGNVRTTNALFSGLIVENRGDGMTEGFLTVKISSTNSGHVDGPLFTVVRWKNFDGMSITETYAQNDAAEIQTRSDAGDAEKDLTEASGYLSHFCCPYDSRFPPVSGSDGGKRDAGSASGFLRSDGTEGDTGDSFPGELGILVSGASGAGFIGNQITETHYDNPQGALYAKGSAQASMTISDPLDFHPFVFRPWIKADYLDANQAYYPGELPENYRQFRFTAYAGGTYSVGDILGIELDFAFRIDTRTYAQVDSQDYFDTMPKFRYSPGISLFGSYDSGLDWGISQKLNLAYQPETNSGNENNYLDSVDVGGLYNLDYRLDRLIPSGPFSWRLFALANWDYYRGIYQDRTNSTDAELDLGIDWGFRKTILLKTAGFVSSEGMSGEPQTVYAGAKASLSVYREHYMVVFQYIGEILQSPASVSGSAAWQHSLELSFSLESPGTSGKNAASFGKPEDFNGNISSLPPCCRGKK